MPPCVKCKKSRPSKIVCFKCYQNAIEELTVILERTEAELRVVTAKADFLQRIVRSKSKLAASRKETDIIVVPSSASLRPNRATGT